MTAANVFRRYEHLMNILLVQPSFPDTFWSFKHAFKFIDKSDNPLSLTYRGSLIA